MNRRDLLKLGLAGGILPFIPNTSPGITTQTWNHNQGYGGGFGFGTPSSPPVTPFQAHLPIPQVLTPTASDANGDHYEITMRQAQAQILPNTGPTTVWGYNGMAPGPTIKARQGRPVIIHQANNLSVSTSVHLHGGVQAPEDDGHPEDLILPNGFKDYYYPNIQTAATLWYHDHAVHTTGRNAYMGLSGFYILQDDLELSLPLPSGDYDVPLVIQDKLFNADGSLNYPALNMNTLQSGFRGDTILVNGAVQPRFEVANRKYRLRILNGSNARQYQLALDNGQPFIQIGSDGGLLPAPVNRTSMLIAPAERLDVVIDFSTQSIGSQIILQNTIGSGRTANIMRFDVVRSETDDSSIPAILQPIARLPNTNIVRGWDLWFNGTNWTINGQTWDPTRVVATPRQGVTEVWRYRNFSQHAHPMHMHLAFFQVLRRFPGQVQPYEMGWKDTINVQNGEEVHVALRFEHFTGNYVHHCHNLEHEDHDMMVQFAVI